MARRQRAPHELALPHRHGSARMRKQLRRGVRAVEGARLESECRGNPTVGSNPTLSAISIRQGECDRFLWAKMTPQNSSSAISNSVSLPLPLQLVS